MDYIENQSVKLTHSTEIRDGGFGFLPSSVRAARCQDAG